MTTEIYVIIGLATIFVGLGLYVIPKMESQLEGPFDIDINCPKCEAPGKKRIYGMYDQFGDFVCEQCGFEDFEVI